MSTIYNTLLQEDVAVISNYDLVNFIRDIYVKYLNQFVLSFE